MSLSVPGKRFSDNELFGLGGGWNNGGDVHQDQVDEYTRTNPGMLPPFTGRTRDESGWGGEGYDYVNGRRLPGTSGFDRDVGRFRNMAANAYGRGAPGVRDAFTGHSRSMVMGSLAPLEAAAYGQAPSVAALQAQQSTEDAIRAGRSMASSVKGGAGARIAAMRNATMQSGQLAAQGGQAAAMARAKEMADARGQYFGATNALYGQDASLAQAQADATARQRNLNAQERQAYERMGFDTRKSEQERYAMRTGAWRDARQQKLQDESEPITWSDARAKTNIVPMGSLAGMMAMPRGR